MADGSSCGDKVAVIPSFGDPYEAPVEDFFENAAPQNQTWNEQSRETSIVNVSGVQVERIDSVTFNTGNGKLVTLVFNN